jgi:cell division protein ZapA
MSAKAKGADMMTLDVSLLGRDYKVACKAAEEAELRDAVALLELRMMEIRDSSKSSSVERVAVMAALNLAHDVQRMRTAPTATPRRHAAGESADPGSARHRIAGMQSTIDQVLAGKEKLF